MTWQDEKAKTQAAMRDIAAQIPKDVVLSVDMTATGILFGCNQTGPNGEKLHSWTGPTSIAVKPGTDIESIVKTIENYYQEKAFHVTSRLDVLGNYEIHMKPPGEKSSYLISEGDINQISIDGWSECFQLPDGLYPGGDF
ncbi:hypothetical protein AB3K78_09610 [Leucobacter sp. HNU]|uniref:hypothetical protein n=1 Tax=Leucobacter sp. HNU TaxID=3236805 RepID=UPI003A809771